MPAVAPVRIAPSRSPIHIRKGREITSPDRTARVPGRGETLSDPRPGLTVEQAPAGAFVVAADAAGAVILWQDFQRAEVQRGRDYFIGEEWEAVARIMAARHYDTDGIPEYIQRLDALVSREVQRQAGNAMQFRGLRELRHADKRRTYRMATSRRNG